MAQKSRVLIIGATGYLGKLMVEASVKSGHPTFALVRESGGSNPERLKLIDSFKNSGVAIVYGDTHHHENLVKAIKQVDVVICTAGFEQMSDQVKIIAAIKEAGNIKRFFPSEFTMDVDHVNAVEPASSIFAAKANIRRSIEAEGIPYTYVVCNAFLGHFLSNLGQTDASAPPRDKVVILGDGNTKATYVKEEDIATYTIKAVDDPRTLNKILYMRLPANTLSFNEIVSLWEKKIGKTLEKTYVLEDELLKKIQESSFPNNLTLSVSHSGFVKGYATNFEIDASSGLDAYEIYPDVKYTTVDEYLDQLV